MTISLSIRLQNNTTRERQAARLLHGFAEQYDLAPWIYTSELLVDENSLPHSHPVLTLNTGRNDDPAMLLSLFIHEQLHWFEEEFSERRDRAILRTESVFPTVPVNRPEGAGSEASTRLHLLVCYLELQALTQLLGAGTAHRIIRTLSRDHYCWVYRMILENPQPIRRILIENGLWPQALIDVDKP